MNKALQCQAKPFTYTLFYNEITQSHILKKGWTMSAL